MNKKFLAVLFFLGFPAVSFGGEVSIICKKDHGQGDASVGWIININKDSAVVSYSRYYFDFPEGQRARGSTYTSRLISTSDELQFRQNSLGLPLQIMISINRQSLRYAEKMYDKTNETGYCEVVEDNPNNKI